MTRHCGRWGWYGLSISATAEVRTTVMRLAQQAFNLQLRERSLLCRPPEVIFAFAPPIAWRFAPSIPQRLQQAAATMAAPACAPIMPIIMGPSFLIPTVIASRPSVTRQIDQRPNAEDFRGQACGLAERMVQDTFCDLNILRHDCAVRQKARLPVWVLRVTLAVGRPLPLYPDQRTSLVFVGMSQTCH